MKKRNNRAMMGLLAASLACSSGISKARNNDGFIAGACAVGAAILGVAGAVAVADWCFSETDDQIIGRINAEYRTIHTQYNDTRIHFWHIVENYHYAYEICQPFSSISESVLHEFATYIWNNGSTQYAYRSGVMSAKNQLKDSVQKLRKRIRALEEKCCKGDDLRRLASMRPLLKVTEELLVNITLFADCLELHKSYFNVYDTVDKLRNRYFSELVILESNRYSVPAELKRCVINNDGRQYALRTFVIKIESDIDDLKSDIRSLAYHYPAKRQYVQVLLDELVEIQHIIMNDPRYQQELYEWEQARLQRLQLQALEAQARAERDRVQALREQNRILEARNQIEREQLRNVRNCHHNNADVNFRVEVII